MRTRLLAILGATAIVVSACSSGGGASASPAASAPASVAPASEAPASSAPAQAPPPAPARASSTAPSPASSRAPTVTASGPFVDQDAVKFNATMKDFEDKTGIDIQYTGTKTFETSIGTRVDAGDPPDIADFPQPGLLAGFAKAGKIIDLEEQARPDRPRRQLQRGLAEDGDHGRRQRRHHGRRLGARQRQELRVVPQEGLRRRGLQGAHDVGRADRARAADHRRRRHPVVHRHQVGRRHRLAGHRLARGLHAAHDEPRQLRRLGQG